MRTMSASRNVRADRVNRAATTRWPGHQTMSRTWATAALPGVIGRPGSDFNVSGPAGALWPP